ncbi:MAG: preprotein translocase subunit Tim44 [Betaproteobacteria bacterium CG2_30_59_46]|nr:MAG: preprotein translocase subunit Tim44 [Betaproteobacteria bacterium CG2_30_59_46]PIQ10020.1 MAG: preprotein translocase subunit Tim44 [Hydrogenophilales bacterium CG18_big_fil_WC_8_21_14_2_50_58_12]PIY01042.1 MAG: Tim44 domain-containing protein [Hydrogenophilales bacterium CG_4_10_14_3_um_filter_58_23]PJB03923.1 MAG: Tim44 domain-containing protein [Hydrogenophilales bacterium CG_4_9_14_3_um_filter_59_35]
MSKFFTLFFVALISFGLTAHDADARRFGGGSSFGKQRQMSPAPQRPTQAPAAAPAPAGGNKWLGPLAGLAAGGLLASLFMGGGMGGLGGGIGNILMILALVGGAFFIFRMLKKPQPQPVQYAGNIERNTVSDMVATGGSAAPGAAMMQANTGSRPAWFEDEPFLREAKKQFIRLQDANDRGDINDIHEYVTPEMYAEISMQIRERNGQPNKTEVVTLNAEIADVVTEGDMVIASVRFSGMIREEANAPAGAFSEIWHIQKSQSQPNATWFISGIQQV